MTQFLEIAAAVAANMGSGWSAHNQSNSTIELKHTDGPSVYLFPNMEKKGQWNVWGNLSKYKKRNHPLVNYPPTINVSYSRPPAAIAADIKRRFIPAFDEAWAKNEAATKEHQAKDDATEQILQLLAQVSDGTICRYYQNGLKVLADDVVAEPAIQDGSPVVRLTLSRLSLELACDLLQIVTLMKKRNQP